MGRTFQIVRPFENMAVLEDVMVSPLVRNLDPKKARDLPGEVWELLDLATVAQSNLQSLT